MLRYVCIDVEDEVSRGLPLVEVELLTGVYTDALRRDIAAGRLPAFKWERTWFVYECDLMAYAAARGVTVTHEQVVNLRARRILRWHPRNVDPEAYFVPEVVEGRQEVKL